MAEATTVGCLSEPRYGLLYLVRDTAVHLDLRAGWYSVACLNHSLITQGLTLEPLVTTKSYGGDAAKCTLETAAYSFTTIGNCRREAITISAKLAILRAQGMLEASSQLYINSSAFSRT